ncbi:MAG: cell division protein FtsZ [Euryarchaeota archaeon ADurb.Bin009]|mgnify:FL=1|jgi:cell division GTPase FtsZ|uniref:tubulin/FtsZ family protein n=1 Tax=Methanoculleus sp. TaxID=90427 RepID=UPI0009C8437C|nr:tubulin/FtsZ family protein [Methanoculleus sp.]OQC71234.1 MAG: cell division protein FtsZ [Euryarchaeota archaeon ADurb.Bin009]HNQ32840.1 tubulin/FtsZ family protein [Methanoculleus sp.]HNT08317.1 tubulin/FtsZ family protein [Methanoculleus sp.]HOC83646.1 tubulin/FtsZ family protein [Methanoculleus sp.]HOI60620.1 tubulin/FtsZ family protein [Methanoculleus sp.]
MRVFFIGFGQAGGKVVDMFIEQDKRMQTQSFRGIAVNTARTDLMGLKHIELKDRLLIGQTVVKGHGVGTDNVTGARVTADEIDSIINAIDSRGTHDVDAFVIIAGLGGGTGSGGSPVLARHLKRIYREPVYAIGILPAPEEGRLYSYNAARSLSTLVNEADNTFIFDNSAWKNEGESVKDAYNRLNDEIVRRFGVLFRAGEVGKAGVGEMVVDSSEVINTLRGGGISTVGYAISEKVNPRAKQSKGLLSGLMRKKEKTEEVLTGEDKSAKIIALVRRAMLGRLTLPCDYSTAERGLVLLAGPPDEMDRKGVEKSKSWVEENIAGVEVRGGDYPVQSDYIAAVVVLATIGNAPRITELLEIAKATKEDVLKSKEKRTTMFDDGIEPLFE